MQLVDEQHDLALGGGNLRQHRLEPLLELAAKLGAGDNGAEIEREQALAAQALGHVAIDDTLGQSLDDRRFADAGLADQDGVVLGAAREDLDGAPDFLVAADHRIELAVPGFGREIAGVFLERLVAVLGARAVGAPALAKVVDGGVQPLRRCSGILEDIRRRRRGLHGQRQQQAFRRDISIARLVGKPFGGFEYARRFRCQIDLAGATAFDLGQSAERRIGLLERRVGSASGGGDQVGRQPLAIIEQYLEQMLRREALVTGAKRQRLRRLHEPARSLGIALEFHARTPSQSGSIQNGSALGFVLN